MLDKIFCAALVVTMSFGGSVANAKSKHCPPGLAKKAVPCVPPGQAKKHSGRDVVLRYRAGEIINDYVVVRDPSQYDLDPYGTYYRSNGYVYQVDSDTRKVLNLIGAVVDILN